MDRRPWDDPTSTPLEDAQPRHGRSVDPLASDPWWLDAPEVRHTDLSEPTDAQRVQEETEAAVRRLLPLMRAAGSSPVDIYDEGTDGFRAVCTVPAGRARARLEGVGASPLEAYEALASVVRRHVKAHRPTVKRTKGKGRRR